MGLRRCLILLFVAGMCVVVALAPAPPIAAGAVDPVGAYLDSVRNEPGRLAAFLRDMPKGADLHMHLSGAASTESLLRFAVADGRCIDTATLGATEAPCHTGQRAAADTDGDPAFHDAVIAAWSMKGFTAGAESGHDHFFAAFDKFDLAGDGHAGDMLAEVAAARALARTVGYDADLAAMRKSMIAHGAMDRIVVGVSKDVDAAFHRMRATLRCSSGTGADAACDLPVRLDYQVLRALPPEVVFAQMLLGFELAAKDHRFVGVNLVQPEDDPVARRDYRLHMQMLAFLRGHYPKARLTLHAGELTAALAPPEDLRFHIRDAVVVAGAERIGHGVDIAGEDGAADTLHAMAQSHVLVEIALTSNEQILGVKGAEHPFSLYRRSGVPVALVTDDEGVSRTDLTAQYQRAVTTYDLGYGDLKAMARAALQHGFLPGADLWQGPDDFRLGAGCGRDRPGPAQPRTSTCKALLRSSRKAKAEWDQEAGFARFERRYGG
jgi:adenosine deaminase